MGNELLPLGPVIFKSVAHLKLPIFSLIFFVIIVSAFSLPRLLTNSSFVSESEQFGASLLHPMNKNNII